jgi:integration host factor subunit alpha
LKKNSVTRAELIQTLAKNFAIPQLEAVVLMEEIIAQIIQTLREESKLKVACFGTFSVLEKKQRLGRNPRTGVQAVISARKSLSFRISGILKRKIARRKALPLKREEN